ncbi:MAG: T9SS type A sorting domain-containing protein, partial [Saprospiraceae bacterium]|nr:T9SS type A sorting domain-containing protein [Saprospiraceae bacterium]
GSLYESIARLETAGESSELQHYNLEHKTPGEGLNYYRLAHYDLDGTLSYSDVKAVDFDKNTSIKIFPNPVQNILTISPVEDFNLESIEIYDMQGVLVETLNTLGDRNDIELSTNDWKAGIYQVLLLRSDGTISVQNIIKQ